VRNPPITVTRLLSFTELHSAHYEDTNIFNLVVTIRTGRVNTKKKLQFVHTVCVPYDSYNKQPLILNTALTKLPF